MSNDGPTPPAPEGSGPWSSPGQPQGGDTAQPAPGYAPAPGTGGYGLAQPGAPVARPKSMDTAVLLMRVGAGLALLNLIFGIVFQGQTKDLVKDELAKSGLTASDEAISQAMAATMPLALVMGLLGAGLWVWMAYANGKGQSWARIVASVFFGLYTVIGLFALMQPALLVGKLLFVVTWLVGLGAIVMMYKKESSDFYAASSAPRY